MRSMIQYIESLRALAATMNAKARSARASARRRKMDSYPERVWLRPNPGVVLLSGTRARQMLALRQAKAREDKEKIRRAEERRQRRVA